MAETSQSIGFELNEHDVVALCQMTVSRSISLPSKSIVPLVVLGGFLVIPAIFFLFIAGSDVGPLAIGIVVLVISALLIVIFAESATKRTEAKRRASALLAAGYGRLTQRRYDITIDADWFISRTELAELRTRWIGIFSIVVHPSGSHVFVYTGSNSAVIVPARAFGSREEFVQFVESMKQYRAQAPPITSRCPRCGYDLRGTLEYCCSECGWTPAADGRAPTVAGEA